MAEWHDVHWTTEGCEEHLERLEKEFVKDPSSVLADHILQLKKAWGFACEAPRPVETGAAA